MHLLALLLILVLRAIALQTRPGSGSLFWANNTPESLLLNLLLLQSWELQNNLSWNNPSWSISTEAFAYLLFPVLCVTSFRMPKTFLVILTLTPILGYSVLLNTNRTLDYTFHLGLLRCISGFILGMSLFRIWTVLSPSARRRLLFLQPVVFVAIPLAMHVGARDGIIVPLLAAGILLTADDRGPVARVLQQGPLVWLGMCSYSIYMIHYPIMYFATELKWYLFNYWVAHSVTSPATLSVVLFIALGFTVLALSALTYRFVEIPMRARLCGR